MSYLLNYQAYVIVEECCVCGGPIALAKAQEAEYRQNHRTFYCSVGHSQSYVEKSDREKLKEAEAALALERSRAQAAKWAKERAEKKAARLLKRAKAGVCPKCNRTFSALARHMKSKHMREAEEPESAPERKP